jgi:NTE family protein
MGRSINQWEVKDADLLIKPVLVGVGSADFGARRRAIQAGRLAMQQAMPQLRALMK